MNEYLRAHAEKLADLDFADDVVLITDDDRLNMIASELGLRICSEETIRTKVKPQNSRQASANQLKR